MRVIPVLDLMGGKVVKGVRGNRTEYQPLKETIFLPSPEASDPFFLLQAMLDFYAFQEIYIADLDSIEGVGNNFSIISSLRQIFDEKILLDIGVVTTVELEIFSSEFSIVVGSETLRQLSDLELIVKYSKSKEVWFSIDISKEKVLSPLNSNIPQDPVDAALLAIKNGIHGILAIELDRVGAETGPNFDLVKSLSKNLSLPFYWGGGVKNLQDLQTLSRIGCDGCLVASALHSGAINLMEFSF